MNNLKDYILHLNKWIPKNILNTTLKELIKNKEWETHQYAGAGTPLGPLNGKKELDVCFDTNFTCFKELMNLTWKAIEKYILIDNISGESFTGWNGFTTLRFNRYKKGQIMSKHADHIQSLFTGKNRGIPILSIVCVLNDNYEGGEFVMFDDYEIKFKPGDLIIFPSIFLYPHLVKPVKKGTRYSFVSWVW